MLESQETKTWRWAMLSISLLAVAVPWLCVTFPPITDLPQHIAQMRLFSETLADPNSPYLIQWNTPNRLVYLLVWFYWQIFPVSWVGNLTMLSLGVCWVVSHHALAQTYRIPSSSAALACLFVFNSSLYWGLLNFLIGWPLFVLWLIWSDQVVPLGKTNSRTWLTYLLLSALLFLAHALWFAVGLLWLGMLMLRYWKQWRNSLLLTTALLPTIVWAILWRVNILASSNYSSGGARWDMGPIAKLQFHHMYTFGAGHLKSTLASIVFALLLVSLGAGAVLCRKELTASNRRLLLLTGLFFLVLYLFLPRMYNTTIQFDRRWLAPAFILLTLGVPAWTSKVWLQSLWSCTLVLLFYGVTTVTWINFDRNETRGLSSALHQINKNSWVLGLDFVKNSPRIDGRPYMHMVAYSQAHHGGRLGFSFATFPTLLVQFKKVTRPPWPVGLEWQPERLFYRRPGGWSIQWQSLLYFDYLLVHAKSRMHHIFAKLKQLQPVGTHKNNPPWRLYQVVSKHRTPRNLLLP